MFITRNKLQLFFFFLIIAVTVQLISSWIVNVYAPATFDEINQIFEENDHFTLFMLFVVVTPLAETFIFQYLCIEILLRFRISISLVILISTLLFALAHSYNVNYILLTIPAGIIYAVYYSVLRKESKLLAYLSVCGVHFVENMIAYLMGFA